MLATLAGMRFSSALQGTDFPDFYCAARMLLDGHGHQLYDAELQRQYQARYSGRVGTLYIHPPFEAALYFAVSWLPMKQAYLAWFFLNLVFLSLAVHIFAKNTIGVWDWRVLLAASLTFVPVLLCLQQGQDSLLLLLLLVLAFVSLRRERAFAAGCWLALGLFKFQIVLPLAFVLIFTQRRKNRTHFALGFSLVALALGAISAAISGASVFRTYSNFLLHLRAQPFAGITPSAMANFRGLISIFAGANQSHLTIAAISIVSVAALIVTLSTFRQQILPRISSAASTTKFDCAFASSVVLALLLSYHLNPHDLSLALLPVFLVLYYILEGTLPISRSTKWTIVVCIGIFFLPLLQLWALRAGIYALLGVPLLALLFISLFVLRRVKSEMITTH